MALNPEVKVMLDLLYELGWKDVSELSPDEARAQSLYFAAMRQFPKPITGVSSTDYYLLRESGNEILLRAYIPAHQQFDATIVFYHGGGYVLGSVEQYDTACRWIASEMGVPLISVDYRLAPEYPFPKPIEDGYAALEWVIDHANEIGMNSRNIIIAGDSAGAHLAIMVGILARDHAISNIMGQWLIYPWVDHDFSRPSYTAYASGFGLTAAAVQWYLTHYKRDNHQAPYPMFPMQISDLTHLPPAYIVLAECDVLHDEANNFSDKLKSSGNIVHLECAEGMIHGFLNQYSVPACFNATLKMIHQMKQHLLRQLTRLA